MKVFPVACFDPERPDVHTTMRVEGDHSCSWRDRVESRRRDCAPGSALRNAGFEAFSALRKGVTLTLGGMVWHCPHCDKRWKDRQGGGMCGAEHDGHDDRCPIMLLAAALNTVTA